MEKQNKTNQKVELNTKNKAKELQLYFKEYRSKEQKSKELEQLQQESNKAKRELNKASKQLELKELQSNLKELKEQEQQEQVAKRLAYLQKSIKATNNTKRELQNNKQEQEALQELEQITKEQITNDLNNLQSIYKELKAKANTCKVKELQQQIIEYNNKFTKELELSINYNSFYNLCKYIVIKSLKTLQAKGNILAIKLLEYKDKYTIEDLIQNVATYYIEQHFNYASFKSLMYQRATEQQQDEELQKVFLNGFKLTSKYLYQFKQKEFKTFYLEDLSNHKEYTLEQIKEQQINNNKVHYTLYKSFEKYLIANNFNKENMQLNISEFKHLKAKAKQKEQLKTLTDYQLEIFLLKAKGYTNPQIAIAKDSNTRAIEKVIQRVYAKLDVKRANNEQKQQQKQPQEQQQELETPCKTTINKALVTKYFNQERIQSKLNYLKQEQQFKELKHKEQKQLTKKQKARLVKARTIKGYSKLYKIA